MGPLNPTICDGLPVAVRFVSVELAVGFGFGAAVAAGACVELFDGALGVFPSLRPEGPVPFTCVPGSVRAGAVGMEVVYRH